MKTCSLEGCERPFRARGFCATHYGRLVRVVPLPPRVCALPECPTTFTPKFEKQRCCSEKHGKWLCAREARASGKAWAQTPWNDRRKNNGHVRRARKRNASVGAPVLLAEIAERDGWRCHICRKRVGRKIAWPHPRSASLDHLVPLSKGGSHDPANVCLAHLGCNNSKGNRAVGEQLLLVG